MKTGGSSIAWTVIVVGLTGTIARGQGKVDPFRTEAKAAKEQAGVISSVELVDTPVTNVFKMISDLTGWSIFMSPEISEKPPKINIWIKNLTPDQVLDRIGTIADLVVERKGNVVEVMTFDEYSRTRGVEKRIVQLKHAKAKDIAAVLQPFMQRDKDKASVGRVLPGEESNKIVLLMPGPLLESLLRVVESLDVPFEKDTVKMISLKHLEAGSLVPRLEKFLSETAGRGGRPGRPGDGAVPVTSPPTGSATAAGGAGETTRAGDRWMVQFMIEPKLNMIVLRGLAADVIQTEELIGRLDTPSSISVVAYQLKYTNARDVYRTLQELVMDELRGGGGGGYGGGMSGGMGMGSGRDRDAARLKVSSSEQNNQIIVEGAPADQARLAKIIAAVDVPLPPSSGGIRVYRLENSGAKEVADVIQGVIDAKGHNGRLAVQERRGGPGESSKAAGGPAALTGGSPGGVPALPPAGVARGPDASGSTGGAGGGADVIPAQVTAAPEINAVVIKASAAEHEEFAVLIRDLDKPRDQVMLEVMLVTVRSTDNFNLGVELSGANLGISTNTIGLTTFGIGKVDAKTGNMAFTQPPPFGANFGVFHTDEFNIVFNALKTVGDTRITATPKILVEDNATAEIKQLSKEPYTTVSQGQNTTLTSFGGFAEAGATLMVVPHVSKEAWLRLEYQVNLSSFDKRTPQQLAANLPPPIRQNVSQGTVRVPADYTVVLGGLAATRDETVRDGVPLLMDIPLLGSLFENRSSGKVKETLFIFIRPVVLRDLKFRDLQFLSLEDVQKAKLSRKDFPENPLKVFTPSANGNGKEQMQ